MIDTAGTITQGAQALIDNGAKSVIACCTHPVLSGPALKRLDDSVISELVVLDTIELTEEAKALEMISQLSVAEIFAESIRRIFNNDSVSKLFD